MVPHLYVKPYEDISSDKLSPGPGGPDSGPPGPDMGHLPPSPGSQNPESPMNDNLKTGANQAGPDLLDAKASCGRRTWPLATDKK